MARTYRPTTLGRLRDRMMTFMLSRGIGPPGLYLLTVSGRKTGIPRTTPVAPLEDRERCWLVAPVVADGWARNARATGRVTLSRGRTAGISTSTEPRPAEPAPVLKRHPAG